VLLLSLIPRLLTAPLISMQILKILHHCIMGRGPLRNNLLEAFVSSTPFIKCTTIITEKYLNIFLSFHVTIVVIIVTSIITVITQKRRREKNVKKARILLKKNYLLHISCRNVLKKSLQKNITYVLKIIFQNVFNVFRNFVPKIVFWKYFFKNSVPKVLFRKSYSIL